jgi:two-component system nitrogen regulation sensor histidine kinase NtrY
VLETTTPAKGEEPSTFPELAAADSVVIRWNADADNVTLAIEDKGPGLMNPSNVFTPFYTTKPHGSGVGLVLSRQIAEAHGGRIEIANRSDARGCLVKVVFPRLPSARPLSPRL